MRHVLAVLCAVSLSGCAILRADPWPEKGSGGFAEWSEITDPRAYALMDRLTKLRERNAGIYAASDLAEAQLLMTRIRRELGGGLATDAAEDMDRLDEKLGVIEKRLPARRLAALRGSR